MVVSNRLVQLTVELIVLQALVQLTSGCKEKQLCVGTQLEGYREKAAQRSIEEKGSFEEKESIEEKEEH